MVKWFNDDGQVWFNCVETDGWERRGVEAVTVYLDQDGGDEDPVGRDVHSLWMFQVPLHETIAAWQLATSRWHRHGVKALDELARRAPELKKHEFMPGW